ncbi:MAG TPA: YXWGXW repeat-containing protein [Puia sp.]|nr:YXWGXW repeat-containing protein [Puia sp.]
MRRNFSFVAFLVTVLCFASCGPAYVVRERPGEVIYLRPAPPSPEHIWVSGDWVWANGHYGWHEGHYETRRPGFRWIEGHWIAVHGGWHWIPGHWRRY